MKLFERKFKPARTDYTRAMLPHNRRQVFFDVMKLHFKEMFILGLISLVFAVPLIAGQIIQDLYASSLISTVTEETSADEVLKIYGFVSQSQNVLALADAVLLTVYAAAFAGILRIVRKFAWEEFRNGKDFVAGIKQNGGALAIIFAVAGLFYALCVFTVNLSTMTDGALGYVLFFPTAFVVLFGVPLFGYTLAATAIYKNKILSNLKIAFFVYFKCPLKTLLAVIICAAFYVPLFIPNFLSHVIGGVLCAIITPFVLLGWLLFSFNMLDEYVNARYAPDVVGKGTFAELLDEEEE